MVAFCEDLMSYSLEVGMPIVHSVHDGQEVPIIHVTVLFRTWTLSRVECYKSDEVKTVVLVDNAGHGDALRITVINTPLSQFEMLQNGYMGERCLQHPECTISIPTRLPFDRIDIVKYSAMFTRCDISSISFEYFPMDYDKVLVNPTRTCVYCITSGIGQHSIIDMPSDCMANPIHTMDTSETAVFADFTMVHFLFAVETKFS